MKNNNKYQIRIPQFDNGHGGVIDNVYQTSGKRSPIWEDGTQLFEGEFNRDIVNRLIQKCQENGYKYYNVVPELEDISRTVRIKRINKYHKENDNNTFLFSIHSNAGGGNGCETFVSQNCSEMSIKMAKKTEEVFHKHFPNKRFRGVKFKNFDLVKLTNCPAILWELFFMDNYIECKNLLLSEEGRIRITNYVWEVLEFFITNK